MSVKENLAALKKDLPDGVQLVLVSKTHPAELIREAYDAGQRDFGENRPQEMKAKHAILPDDIRWHMIGHLQTNKVKYLAPFVTMIHSVDSVRLAMEIDRQAQRNRRVIDVLLEVHIAADESKEGWFRNQLEEWLESGEYRGLQNIRFRGVMGVASLTDDVSVVRREFLSLTALHGELRERFFDDNFDTISMGMSSDYKIAVECGSTMVRVGSRVFGQRYR